MPDSSTLRCGQVHRRCFCRRRHGSPTLQAASPRSEGARGESPCGTDRTATWRSAWHTYAAILERNDRHPIWQIQAYQAWTRSPLDCFAELEWAPQSERAARRARCVDPLNPTRQASPGVGQCSVTSALRTLSIRLFKAALAGPLAPARPRRLPLRSRRLPGPARPAAVAVSNATLPRAWTIRL